MKRRILLMLIAHLFILLLAYGQGSLNLSAVLDNGIDQAKKGRCDIARMYYNQYNKSKRNAQFEAKARQLNTLLEAPKCKTRAILRPEMDEEPEYKDLSPITSNDPNGKYVTNGNTAFKNGNYRFASECYLNYVLSNTAYFDNPQNFSKRNSFYDKIQYCQLKF